MNQYEAICKTEADKLKKAFQHLIYSYLKIKNLSTHLDALDEQGLADWESFSARFSRVADIFLSKYLRARIMMEDPGFKGTMRDIINFGEKLEISMMLVLGWPFENYEISLHMITQTKRWESFLNVYAKNITACFQSKKRSCKCV